MRSWSWFVLGVLCVAVASGCAERTPDSRSNAPAPDGGGDAGSLSERACLPGRQEACACPGTSRTGVQVCVADGSRYGFCSGCPDDSGGAGSSHAGSASMDAGSEAAPSDPAGPYACVETDLAAADDVSRDVVGPATHVYRWEAPKSAVYRLDGADGGETPLLAVRRSDCADVVAQELSGPAPIVASLEAGAVVIITATWASDTRTTFTIAEVVQADCDAGEVDCGSGCVVLANGNASCGCNTAMCASRSGKKTECVAIAAAPYGACEAREPVECDDGLVLCGETCLEQPPAGYAVCSDDVCRDVRQVEHCGSACVDCRSAPGAADPPACVAHGDDYVCQAESCPDGQVDCGLGCVNVVGEACGCDPVCCQTWLGTMTCAIEENDAVCRSVATEEVTFVDRQVCVGRGSLPP